MKKIVFLVLLIIAVGISSGIWFYNNSQPVNKEEKFTYFIIEKGTPASRVGAKLQSAGLIRSGLAFKLYMQFTGQTGKIQTGEFKLTPSYSLFQTVSALFKGPVELWVTIPEGLRREEVAQKFASTLGQDSGFIAEFLSASKGKEGYLFPETYLFPREASASAIVGRMLNTFSAKTTDLKNNSGMSFEKAIIMASLIERETKTDTERPVVAGILINRLNDGWPLQVDASVQYALANSKCQTTNNRCDWWPTVYTADLEINSPYNTYKFAGLPPTPIANPGLSSIKAALNPTANDYWYYIHDESGQIHYAKTLAEHNYNISKYLK